MAAEQRAAAAGTDGVEAEVAGVAAVVVNYNARDHLLDCVRSLRAEGVQEVVVVDNASTDGSGPALAASDPDAVWLATGANIGFGAAANRGAARTSAPLLLVCNPDLVVEPGAVRALAATVRRDPGLALVGARIESPAGAVYPSPRRFPGLTEAAGHAFLDLLGVDNVFTRRYRMLDDDRSRPATDVDWVSGSCFMARRATWQQLGGFDEAYFMFAEDVDLCWRAGQSGWRVGFEPAARVTHVQGVSVDQHPYRMLAAHHRSILRFYCRTAEGWRRLLAPVVAAALALRLVAACGHRAAQGRRGR